MIGKIVKWAGILVIGFFVLMAVVIQAVLYFDDTPHKDASAQAAPDPAALRQREVQRAINQGEMQLIAKIKANMHDPGSFELVDDRAIDAGDHITMVMSYRGRNGFNALRTERVGATFDLQGNITSVQKIE